MLRVRTGEIERISSSSGCSVEHQTERTTSFVLDESKLYRTSLVEILEVVVPCSVTPIVMYLFCNYKALPAKMFILNEIFTGVLN